MWTMIALALLCLAFGLRVEGTVTANWHGLWLAKIGRLKLAMVEFRPGRLYYRMEAI